MGKVRVTSTAGPQTQGAETQAMPTAACQGAQRCRWARCRGNPLRADGGCGTSLWRSSSIMSVQRPLPRFATCSHQFPSARAPDYYSDRLLDLVFLAS